MALAHSKATRILLNQVRLDRWLKTASPEAKVDMGDTTAIADDDKTQIPGQRQAVLNFTGMFDGNAVASDNDFYEILQGLEVVPQPLSRLSYAQQGFGIGQPVLACAGRMTQWQPQTPFNGVAMLNPSFVAEDRFGLGPSLHDILTGESASTSSASVDNTAATTSGLIGYLHVIANNRNGSSTLKIQHSVDNSVWVDLVTFTAVGINTLTSERIVVAGTVNRYLRAQSTLAGSTGSITYAVTGVRT